MIFEDEQHDVPLSPRAKALVAGKILGAVMKISRRRILQMAATAAALSAVSAVARAQSYLRYAQLAKPSKSLIVSPGREFAADSFVHTPLPDNAPLDARSAQWSAALNRQMGGRTPYVGVNIWQYAPPIFIVGPDVPTVQIKPDRGGDPQFMTWGWPLGCELSAVPLPPDFAPSPGRDGEAIIYQPSTKKYWELWLTVKTGARVRNSAGVMVDEWSCGWGGYIRDISTNPGYFPPATRTAGSSYAGHRGSYDGYLFGASATSIAMLSSLITIEEQQRGVINHPVGFCVPYTLTGPSGPPYAPPAQRSDGWDNTNPDSLPEGLCFRFPASLNLDALHLDPYALMIARAIQKYGMYLRDTGGSVVIYAENPGAAGHYNPDPYNGSPTGILRCATPHDRACHASTQGRLAGIPWGQLQVLQANLVTPS